MGVDKSTNAEKIEDLDERVKALEISGARLDERISSLVSSTQNLKWSIWGFSFILLLAVIYGALGDKGFNAITRECNNQAIYQESK